MTCFSPLRAFESMRPKSNGRRDISFDPNSTSHPIPIPLPCGNCKGCRLNRSKEWAARCLHEANLYEHNCYITLTYSDEFLPEGKTLVKKHFQDFMKRLRKRFSNQKIRFFHCGEYGEKYGRPHYHALLFNFAFIDMQLFKISPSGEKLYRSPILEELWPFGYSSIGAVTFESAAYVARYIMKKQNGENADLKYNQIQDLDVNTGECVVNRILPEYTTMSRRPGIGKEWYDRYKYDYYSDDKILIPRKNKLVQIKPPRYYDKLYEVDEPQHFNDVKQDRIKKAYQQDISKTQLLVKANKADRNVNLLKRNLEDSQDI